MIYALISTLCAASFTCGLLTPETEPNGSVTLSDQIAVLKNIVKDLQSQVRASNTELESIKDELVSVKSELSSATSELIIIKDELGKSNMNKDMFTINGTVLSTNKRELETLKTHVYRSERELQSDIVKLQTDLQKRDQNLASDVQRMEEILESSLDGLKLWQNITRGDVEDLRLKLKTVSEMENFTRGEETHFKVSVETQLSALQSSIGDLTASVKFQVQQNKSLPSVTNNETLRFDTVRVNDGNGYNTSTGIFTSPVSGTYVIWLHVLYYTKNSSMNIAVYCNGTKVARGASETGQNSYGDVAITFVIQLSTKDQVWFVKEEGSSSYIEGALYSSYGGVLISRL